VTCSAIALSDVMGDDRNAHRCCVRIEGEANSIGVGSFSDALPASYGESEIEYRRLVA
jgi:hypothetical protein